LRRFGDSNRRGGRSRNGEALSQLGVNKAACEFLLAQSMVSGFIAITCRHKFYYRLDWYAAAGIFQWARIEPAV
jgi:hypothetical protein